MRKVNRRVLEALIHCGAMDSLNCERAVLMASLENVLKAAEQALANQNRGQNDLFASASDQHNSLQIEYINAPAWSAVQRLRGEKETLGFYLTGHPIDQYQQELSALTNSTIKQLSADNEGTTTIAGLVMGVRTLITKRGDRMAIITLNDNSGRLDIAVFSDVYAQHKEILQKDQLLIIEGEVSHDDFSGGLRMSAKRIMDMRSAREQYGKYILLKISQKNINTHTLEKLESLLRAQQKGICPLVIEYLQQQASVRLVLGKQWRICPDDELLLRLRDLVGEQQVSVQY